MKHGQEVPGPVYNIPSGAFGDRLGVAPRKMTNWDKDKEKAKSLKVKVHDIAPNHYKIDFARTEPSSTNYTVPKGVGNNFIDKFVKEKWIDSKSKKEIPGPAHYDMQNFNLEKTSRGTFHCQLRGLTRSP